MTEQARTRTRRYLVVVIRWVVVVVLLFAVLTGLGVYVIEKVMIKTYEATAQIQISSPPRTGTDAHEASSATAWQTDSTSIESPDILQPVIDELGLARTWADPTGNGREQPLDANAALSRLRARLTVRYAHDSNLVDVRASSADPQEAQAIANAVVDEYRSYRNSMTPLEPGSPPPVMIITRADVPVNPSRPDKRFDYAVTVAGASVLSIMLASLVEVLLLIARAEEAASEPLPLRPSVR